MQMDETVVYNVSILKHDRFYISSYHEFIYFYEKSNTDCLCIKILPN